MRISINLPDTLLQQAKAHASQNKMKFDDLVAQSIEDGLREKIANTPVPQREQVPLPIFRKAGGAPIPARSNAELFEILEGEITAFPLI